MSAGATVLTIEAYDRHVEQLFETVRRVVDASRSEVLRARLQEVRASE